MPRVLDTDSRFSFQSPRRSTDSELASVDPLSVRRRSARIPGVIDVAKDRFTDVRNEDGPGYQLLCLQHRNRTVHPKSVNYV